MKLWEIMKEEYVDKQFTSNEMVKHFRVVSIDKEAKTGLLLEEKCELTNEWKQVKHVTSRLLQANFEITNIYTLDEIIRKSWDSKNIRIRAIGLSPDDILITSTSKYVERCVSDLFKGKFLVITDLLLALGWQFGNSEFIRFSKEKNFEIIEW